jgi:hypothetical protein
VRTATARALASGDRIVDVRSEHPGFAPEAQGAGRIERLRGPEGPGRLGVIEGPRVPVALIEIRLRVLAVAATDQVSLPRLSARVGFSSALGEAAPRGRSRVGPEFVAPGRRLRRLRLSLRHYAAVTGMLSADGGAVQKAHPRAVVSAERTRADRVSCREQQGRRCRGAGENDALRRTGMSKRRKDHGASPTRGLVQARLASPGRMEASRAWRRTAHRRKS